MSETVEVDLVIWTFGSSASRLEITRVVNNDEHGFQQFMDHCANAWARVTAEVVREDES